MAPAGKASKPHHSSPLFGLDAITNKRLDHLKMATVGNPAMHIPTVLGAIPGMSAFATHMMKREIENWNL
jgi:hypothetical protein